VTVQRETTGNNQILIMSSKPLRVVVAGAGTGGLAMAHELLHRMGDRVHVRVLEAVPVLRPKLGAGFTLSGGLQCLRNIPVLADKIDKIGVTPLRFRTLFDDGTVFRSVSATDLVGDPPSMAQFMRDELQMLLYHTLPKGTVECGKRVVKVDQDARIVHTQKESIPFDLLIGADGIKSQVKCELFDKTWERQYSGLSMYYCVIPDSHIKQYGDGRFEEGSITETIGKGTCQTAFACGSKREWTLGYAYRAKKPPCDSDWAATDHIHESTSEITRYASRAMHFGLYHTPPKAVNWVNDRVVLMGDAAHAATPFMGQGANQAIQDATCLARLLAEDPDNIDAALARYYKIREPVTSQIINASKYIGWFRTSETLLERTARNIAYRCLFANDGFLFKKSFQNTAKPVI